MTDHEKLLVAMLSEAEDDLDDTIPTPAVMTLLYELGNGHRSIADMLGAPAIA